MVSWGPLAQPQHWQAPIAQQNGNHTGLAAVVGRVFCPSIATDSMAAAVAADTGKFTASQSPSVWGAEEAVSGALAHAAQLQPVS